MSIPAWDPRCAVFSSEAPPLTSEERDLELAYTNLLQNAYIPRNDVVHYLYQFKCSLNRLDISLRPGFIKNGLEDAWLSYKNQLAVLLLSNVALHSSRIKSEPITIHTPEILQKAVSFKKDGYFVVNFGDKLDFLARKLQPYILKLQQLATEGLSNREDLTISFSLEKPDFIHSLNSLLTDFDIFNSVSGGMGHAVTSQGFSLELSVPKASWWSEQCQPNHSSPANTAYFHRDETPHIPKAVIYLSDVDELSGPFSLCPSSYKKETSPIVSAASRCIFYGHKQLSDSTSLEQKQLFESLLPPSQRSNSHYGFDLADHSSQSNELLNDEKVFTGNRGTCIVFDGYGLLHRGGLCTQKPRLALQVMLPCSNYELELGDWISLYNSL